MDAVTAITDVLTKPQRPFQQFSLRTMLFLITIGCLAGSHWLTSIELNRMRQEVRGLRNQLGHLTIDDPNKINVIRVPTHETMKWSWRIRLPPGSNYSFNFRTSNILDDNFPNPQVLFAIQRSTTPIECTLSIIGHREQNGEWRLTAISTTGHCQALGFMTSELREWLKGDRGSSESSVSKRKTTAFPANQNVELLRVRLANLDERPMEMGLLVWIKQY